MFNYGKQYIDQDDILAVSKSLKAKYLTGGLYVDKLEKQVSKKFKCKYAIACNSGTSGIHLALTSINLKKGDNVIIPAINFVAAANVCKLKGANIYFADVDQNTFQVGKQEIIQCIKKNNLKSIKVIFTMHLGGGAIHQSDIFKLKKKYNFILIEDACHALGAKYSNTNKYVGSGIYSDFTIFSLHPVKSMTSGEGGLICLNNRSNYIKILSARSHGITNRKNYTYEINQSSLNFRCSDINCSLAISQLKKLDKMILKRRRIANRYQNNLKQSQSDFEIVNSSYTNNSACHLLIIKFKFNDSKLNLNKIFIKLKKKKIFTQQHYIPTYRFLAFKGLVKKYNNFPHSEDYNLSCLSLPIYYSLSIKNVDKICKEINKIFI
jgi:dTDP-4-amino-4,6-dideoxygalactose transaminase